MCPGVNWCRTCSRPGHKEEDCQVQEDETKWKCINCPQGKDNHTCWSHKCPVKQQKREEARRAYQERPYRFQESTSPSLARSQSPTGPLPARDPSSPTFTASMPRTTEASQEPASTQDGFLDRIWEEVTSWRRAAGSPVQGASNPKKARRGAPTLGERLQKAANKTGQEKLNFVNN